MAVCRRARTKILHFQSTVWFQKIANRFLLLARAFDKIFTPLALLTKPRWVESPPCVSWWGYFSETTICSDQRMSDENRRTGSTQVASMMAHAKDMPHALAQKASQAAIIAAKPILSRRPKHWRCGDGALRLQEEYIGRSLRVSWKDYSHRVRI